MVGAALRSVGSIDLADLATVYERQGHEYLPYPFMQTRSLRQDTRNTDPSSSDHFNQGDPSILREWMDTYTRADIWVECRVIYSHDGTPDVRILAFRAGESGFVATQRHAEDIVDVLSVTIQIGRGDRRLGRAYRTRFPASRRYSKVRGLFLQPGERHR